MPLHRMRKKSSENEAERIQLHELLYTEIEKSGTFLLVSSHVTPWRILSSLIAICLFHPAVYSRQGAPWRHFVCYMFSVLSSLIAICSPSCVLARCSMKQFCVCHVCSVLSSLIAVLYVPPRCIDKMHHDAILCVPRVQRSVVFDCYLFPQLCIGKMHHDAIFCLPRVQRSVVFDCYLSVVLHPAVCKAFWRLWLLSVPLLYRKGPLLPLHRPVGDPSPQPAHRHDGRHLCQGECMPRSPLWFNKIMPKRIWVA